MSLGWYSLERADGFGVKNCIVLSKSVQTFSISFLSVCKSFSSFFISHIVFFGPSFYICFGPLPLWSRDST